MTTPSGSHSSGAGQPGQAQATRPASYRDVFAVAEFRAVFWADLFSLLGDQVAAVAVAVLLYQRTGSALYAALGYATAYVPGLLGGPLLAAWAERLPARSVLVGCDLGRAVLIGLAAVPGLPLPLVGLLVLASAMLGPPFDAARSALIPQIMLADRYPVAMSLRDAVHQSTQLIGAAAGGALVLAVSAQGALAIDAVTFVCSGLLLRFGLRFWPANNPGPDLPGGGSSLWRETVEGFSIVRRDRWLSRPLLLGIVGAGYAVVPEAIAPAYAHSLGHGASGVGLIMGSVAGGSVLGGLAMGRLVSSRLRDATMYPLALLGAVPLLFVALRPGLVVSLALFAVTGLTSAFQISANTMFARNVPPAARARAFGIAIAGMQAGQALAIMLAGAMAQFLPPANVVAVSAVVGAVIMLLLGRLPGPDRSPAPGRASQQAARPER